MNNEDKLKIAKYDLRVAKQTAGRKKKKKKKKREWQVKLKKKREWQVKLNKAKRIAKIAEKKVKK